MNDKISIIVPVYKVERYLDKCIQSIVDQSYNNLEIILVDDGSPDNCSQMCDNWAKKDERIKVIHKNNGGLMSAWLDGIKISTCDYISFVDSDDYVLKDFISSLYKNMLTTDSDISICGFFTDCDGNKKEILFEKTFEFFEKRSYFNCCSILAYPYCFAPCRWNKLFKKSILLDCIKYLDTSITMAEDVNLTFCALSNAQKISYVNEFNYGYRVLTQSMSHVNKNNWQSFLKVLTALNTFIVKEKVEQLRTVFNYLGFGFIKEVAFYFISNNDKNNFYGLLQEDFVYDILQNFKPIGNSQKLIRFFSKIKMKRMLYLIFKRSYKNTQKKINK